ncbi:MAG: hypothetical protein HY257_11585 [Chloroflexi bacterium]|nr:hypothetical protein [Chloroflexota bacterium]
MNTNPLSLKGFLTLGGVILLLLAVLGFVGFSIGETLWFDNAENVAHLVLGVVAVAAVYVLPENLLKPLVVVVGVVALFFGLYGFVLPAGAMAAAGKAATYNTFGVANLESPVDNVLHLVVGVWALYVAFMGKGEAMMAKK